MADLLLELFSEEIPARMQAQAAKDLERLVVGALSDRGLLFEGAKAFAGPRRLTLAVAGLPAKQPDVSEEKKGPRVGAPEKAIEGFLRSAGVTLDQCERKNDGKGEFYVAVIARKGRATAEVLADVLPEAFAKLPWPKSMRFPGSAVRWVRPLHAIVCTLDGEVVPFEFAGVKSGNATLGHRFLSKGVLGVRRFDDYEKTLRDAHVILDAAERKDIILNGLKQQSFALGLEPIADEGLLDEVAGLAEWPVVLVGTIEDQFMDVPPEILQTSMRTHQKYFSLRDPKTGRMANRFAVVSNMVARDGGREIVAGNERVLRARLSDAKFFWDQDRKRTLESRIDDLKGIVFHAKLGTQYERVERIAALAGEIAAKIGADVDKAKRAARLCKADLTTGVVGEFPELQGVMGRYYALYDGEDAEVADAVRDHYKPVGAGDDVPTNKISLAVALADKFDTLACFFIGTRERPTGSKDPYALRRAALGVVRSILENALRVSLRALIDISARLLVTPQYLADLEKGERDIEGAANWLKDKNALPKFDYLESYRDAVSRLISDEGTGAQVNALPFIGDRFRVQLRDRGYRFDALDATFQFDDWRYALKGDDDLVRIVARVEALQSFLKTAEGANLLAGYKRAANILKAEEKKDKATFGGAPAVALLKQPEEKALAEALTSAETSIATDVAAEKFVEAMGVMAKLRAPVDAFFEHVKVNDDDPAVRRNRLMLLARLRATLHLVADFSKIEG